MLDGQIAANAWKILDGLKAGRGDHVQFDSSPPANSGNVIVHWDRLKPGKPIRGNEGTPYAR